MFVRDFRMISLRSEILRRLQRLLHLLRVFVDPHASKITKERRFPNRRCFFAVDLASCFRGGPRYLCDSASMPEETRSLWEQYHSEVEPWRRGQANFAQEMIAQTFVRRFGNRRSLAFRFRLPGRSCGGGWSFLRHSAFACHIVAQRRRVLRHCVIARNESRSLSKIRIMTGTRVPGV